MSELKYLNKYLIKYKANLLLGFFIIIIARILLLFTPGLIRESVNVVDEYRKGNIISIETVQTELIQNIFLILLAAVAAGIFTFLTRQTIINVSRFVEFDLKNEIYTQYQKLSLSFYKKNQTGDLMNRISEDVSRVRMYFGPALMYSINTITLLIITFFYMYKQSPELTIYTISPLPILSYTIYKLSGIINTRSRIVQESLSKLSSFSQEVFTGIQIVKSYAIQKNKSIEFDNLSEKNKDNQISLVKVQALFFPLMILLIGISNILVIYIGGKQYLSGEIENIGIIAEFIIYVNMLTWPVASLGWISSIIQQAEASQKRINEFLKEKSEISYNENGLKEIIGSLEFKDVSFTYTETNIKAIDNISFKLNEEKSLGIVGVTGSGKTTLIKLLTKSYKIDSGEILFDNNSIDEFDLEYLRKEIGVVSQDSFLFSDSIINNIRFGKEKASLTEVEEVCKISGIHNEIIKFSNGYETILGERGINLSGGQKQRLSIARAVLKNPPIMILDEATSSIDSESEQWIQRATETLTQGRTSLLVAHRLNTVRDADRIVVLQNGAIAEQGTHDELVARGEIYHGLFEKQIQSMNLK